MHSRVRDHEFFRMLPEGNSVTSVERTASQFACITMPALAGPGGYTAMDIPHNTTWEIK
jgi:hypothetical protein